MSQIAITSYQKARTHLLLNIYIRRTSNDKYLKMKNRYIVEYLNSIRVTNDQLTEDRNRPIPNYKVGT